MPTVGIIGTFDTKGNEFDYLQRCIRALGVETVTIDCGVGQPLLAADIRAEAVAHAAGLSFTELRERRDRGEWVAAMAQGAAIVSAQLYREGRIHALVSLGGSAGTTIGTAAMRALPVGAPKLMVSTMASGDTRPYVDTKDICMMYSVVDIAGVNRFSRRILRNAAAAISGMAGVTDEVEQDDRPLIAATMFGVTTPCVTRAREVLESAGYEVLVFHATGTGGRAMEDLVRGGFLAGVLDVTTTELADELVGGVLSAGPQRLETAGLMGIPQVVCPGAIDMVNFGPRDTIPRQFADRVFYEHNASVTLMRTTPDENAELGRITARKLNDARGPVTVLLPLQGVSALDRAGQPFHDSSADAAYREALTDALAPSIGVRELDLHINDPAFAEAAAQTLLEMMRNR
jgi:uncharacterized protein (UPF0261 family)